MNSDIRLKADFLDHAKTGKLKRRLDADAVLCLIRLWCYTARNKPKGVLPNDPELIEIAANWQGKPDEFFNTLVDVGFLDVDGDSIIIHDWEQHQPWAVGAEARSIRARKAAHTRWGACSEHALSNAGSMLAACGEQCLGNAPLPSPPFPSLPLPSDPNQSDPKESKPKKNLSPKEVQQKEVIATIKKLKASEALKASMIEFAEHRVEIKSPMTSLAATKLFNALSKKVRTDNERVELIDKAIRNGWKGVVFSEDRWNAKNQSETITGNHFADMMLETGTNGG